MVSPHLSAIAQKTCSCVVQLLLSSIVASVVGLLCAGFGHVLLWCVPVSLAHPLLALVCFGFAGLISADLWRYTLPHIASGMQEVRKAQQGLPHQLHWLLVPSVAGTTWIAHLVGASVGREGVAVQIGGTIGWLYCHLLARLHTRIHNAYLRSSLKDALQAINWISLGMAAGFAGLFHTPLAGAAFALELQQARTSWKSALSILVAALVASYSSHLAGLAPFHVTGVPQVLPSVATLLFLMLLAAVCAGVGILFVWCSSSFKQLFARISSRPLRFLIGGTLIAGALWAMQGRYNSLGTNLITWSFLQPEHIQYFDWIGKLLATTLSLGIGFQGGEVTPLFAIGSSLGISLAYPFHQPALWAGALGYVGVFTSASRLRLAPILICFEVFGFATGLWAIPFILLIHCVPSSFSIYPKFSPDSKSSQA